MDGRKAVNFYQAVRVRWIEPRCDAFMPKIGDWVIAQWWEDKVFYRARILQRFDDGYYWMSFPGYGEGMTWWQRIYKKPSEIPPGSMVDETLHEDILKFRERRNRGNQEITEESVFDNLNREITLEEEAVEDISETRSQEEGGATLTRIYDVETSEEETEEESDVSVVIEETHDTENENMIETTFDFLSVAESIEIEVDEKEKEEKLRNDDDAENDFNEMRLEK